MRKIKKLALECILLSMEEIKKNLESTSIVEDVKANADAMVRLANAYHIVKRG